MAKNITIWALSLLLILSVSILSFGTHGTKAYDPDIINTVTTTNATPTNILSVSLGTGKTIRIVVDILGVSGNNRLRGRKTACIKNISGTLSIIGSIASDIVATSSDAGLAAAGFDIGISGTNVIVPVTGIAATTINWTSNTTYILN